MGSTQLPKHRLMSPEMPESNTAFQMVQIPHRACKTFEHLKWLQTMVAWFSYQKQSHSFISSGPTITRLFQWMEDFPVTEQGKLVGFILVSTDLAWLFEPCKNTYTHCSCLFMLSKLSVKSRLTSSCQPSFNHLFSTPALLQEWLLDRGLSLWKGHKSKCSI